MRSLRKYLFLRALGFGLLSAALALTGAVTAAESLSDVVVSLACGKLKGVDEGDVLAYKGVPYAAPPVGERRSSAMAGRVTGHRTVQKAQDRVCTTT